MAFNKTNWEDIEKIKVIKIHILNKSKKCSKCGLYGCICQLSLKEFL